MQTQAAGPLTGFGSRVLAYTPTLAAGLLVLGVGLVVGWLAKRAIVRVLIWLRLDRLGGRASWRAAFGKGDVRAALYELVGNLVMLLVALVFLNNSLHIWGLSVLSRRLEDVILYVPNLALVALIVSGGLFLANTAAERVQDTLEEEGAPRARFVASSLKATLIGVVAALALWQLNFAREIVLSAFLIGFGAIGVAFALAVGLGSSRAIAKGWETLFQERGKRE